MSLSRAYPDFQHESPHNVFLDSLVAQGIPGLLLFVGIAVLALYQAFCTPESQGTSQVLGAALAGGLVAQQFNVFTLPTALYFYLMMAMITACCTPVSTLKPVPVWTRISSRPLRNRFCGLRRTVDRSGSSAFAYPKRRYQRRCRTGARALSDRSRSGIPQGSSADLYLSRELANRFRISSDVRIKLQTWTPAFRAAVRAVTTSEERQNAFYNLAIFFATQNDSANVERSLRNAIVWAPNWFKPHWTLAKLYSTQKRLQEAEREAQLAVELNGGKDEEVTRTLNDIRSAIARKIGTYA